MFVCTALYINHIPLAHTKAHFVVIPCFESLSQVILDSRRLMDLKVV